MTDAIDFGPSEMRLAEIGALQERVRVLKADLWRAIEQHGQGKFCAHCGAPLFDDEEPHWMTSPDGDTFCFQYVLNQANLKCFSYRARALSEMAAADAEMLP